MTNQIDLDDFFVDDGFFFDLDPPVFTDSSSPSGAVFYNPSPDSASSWIGQVESLLMTDDDHVVNSVSESNCQPIADFLSDILVDCPAHGPGVAEETVDCTINGSPDIPGEGSAEDRADLDKDGDKESDGVANDSGNGNPEKESGEEAIFKKNGVHDDDDNHVDKKRKRQLRNRDAALRSRERKKMHLKDLEMKSKFLEAECRRLGRLLQCCIAENQTLRLCLQRGGSRNDASMARQESAVLFWESLLLGSLLWSLGIICLFPLVNLSPPAPEPVRAGHVGPENGAPREQEIKRCMCRYDSFVKSRKCKASRTRMKTSLFDLRVLGWITFGFLPLISSTSWSCCVERVAELKGQIWTGYGQS